MSEVAPWRRQRDLRAWSALLALSGAVGLSYELVWMRRVGLLLGGSAPAAAATVGAFMGGLALGAALSPRLRLPAGRAYALLEAVAAAWALAFPWLLHAAWSVVLLAPSLAWATAALLLLPPAAALGATWPVLARAVGPDGGARLYAANTAGAVVGVLGASFVLLPSLGVRGAELAAATSGLLAAGLAWRTLPPVPAPDRVEAPALPSARILAAAGAAGLSVMGLEVAWFRLAAVALGATVQVHALVLAVFLVMLAGGAWIGRRWPADPGRGLAGGLTAVAVLALLGAAAFGWMPYGVAAVWRAGGAEAVLPGTTLLAALAMGGAPAASGLAYSAAIRSLGEDLADRAGALLAANTLGGLAGAWLAGLLILPGLELHGAVLAFSAVAALGAAGVARAPRGVVVPLITVAVLGSVVPAGDPKLFAVGVHLRVSDFADPTAEEVTRFAHEGWELLSYDHGPTAAVAVGRSTATGNVWLSINGKVDASTGDDMPTQELSGSLPVAIAGHPERVLVVGLASGVTAGAVLADPRVRHLDVAELEPAVVDASHAFDHVNGQPLDDPRTVLHVDDARALLARPGPAWDVIVSEPSNPWISGVSNLFTHEYWRAARGRLTDDGVMCQWVQLYGMGPDQFRALVRTFTDVFPDTWLFETIPGSDALLIGGAAALPDGLPLQPTLTPAQVRRLGGEGWLNTDDHPRVEWEAPRYLHYATARLNAEAIAEAARTPP